jgi:hypothetical protein
MSAQAEDAILNVKINGEQAISTFKDLNTLRREQLTLVKGLKENTPAYDEQAAKLRNLNTQFAVWKQNLYGVNEAMEGATQKTSRFAAAINKVTSADALGARVVSQFSRQIISLGTGFLSMEIGAKAIKAVVEQIQKLDYFTGRLNQGKQNILALNAVQAEADKEAGKQIGTLKILYDTATDVNRSMHDRLVAANALRDEFPTEFQNSTSLAIVNGQLRKSYDELTASIIRQAQSQAASSKIGELAGKKLDNDYQIDKNNSYKEYLEKQAQEEYQQNKKNPNQNFEAIALQQNAQNSNSGINPLTTGITINSAESLLKAKLAAIKKMTDDKNYEPATGNKVIQKTQEFLETYVNTITKGSKSLDDANKLLGPKLENFNHLVTGADDKLQLENIKSALQVKLDALAPNDKQIAVIRAKIEQVEKLEKQYDAKLKGAHGHNEQNEAVSKQKAIDNDLAKLDAERVADTKSANDKEIAEVQAKYNELKQKELEYQVWVAQNKNLTKKQKTTDINASNSTIGKIGDDQDAAVNALKAKQAGDLSKEIQKYQDEQAANYSGNLDKEIAKNKEFYDDLRSKLAANDFEGMIKVETARILSDAKSTYDAKLEQERKYQEEIQQLRDQYAEISDDKETSELAKIKAKYDKDVAMFKDQLDKKLISAKEYQEAIDLLNKIKAAHDEKATEDEQKKIRDTVAEYTQEAANMAFKISQQNRDTDLANTMTKLDKERTAELSNVNLTASQKVAINNKFDEEEAAAKLKKWNADHEAAIANAIINTAVSVTKELDNPPLAIEVGIAGAAQVAEIVAQKAPQFEDGGFIPYGPTHPSGGLNVSDPMGNLVASIEGGEGVLSRATVAANPNLVASLMGSGGQTVNYEKVLAAANTTRSATPRFAAGNDTGIGSFKNSGSSSGNSDIASHIAEMKAVVNQAMQVVMQSDSKPVILSNRVVADNEAKMAEISNAVNA